LAQQTQEIVMAKRNTLMLAGAFLLAICGPTQAALFFTDTIIGDGDTNYDGQDIVVVGCTIAIDGSHGFSDLVIIENGVVTHSPIDTNASGGLDLSISNNLVIESGSSIDAQGLGFGPGFGTGAGTSIDETNREYGFYYRSGGGGAYGGNGGFSTGGAPGGAAYGLPVAPTNAGSGGGEGFGSGGAGGGVVNLIIGGALVVDGEIIADGSNGVDLASGGGSGGAINISVPSISGNGSISANGGISQGLDGGGGGGGRIALFFTTNGFTGSISAAGGQGAEAGGAGTVYLQSESGGDQVLVDNAGVSGTNTPLTVPVGSSVSISGGAVAYFPVEATLSSLAIDSNSWLAAGPTVTDRSYTLSLTVESNATIQTGGGISFDGAGGLSETGSGGVARTNDLVFGGGGGNGGLGGGGFGAAGGESIGSYLTPTAVGGAGGEGGVNDGAINPGGPGGGALDLRVTGTLTLNGRISANGGAGAGDGSGGGAGGSIYLTVGTLAGGGTVAAVGGAAGSSEGGGDGGGGGGGRLAVYASSNQFTGLFSAQGGPGFVNGGAGTIYLTTTAGDPSLPPQPLLDNAGLAGAVTPIAVIQGVMDFTVTNAAVAALSTGLTVYDFMVASNSFVQVSNANTSLSVLNDATIQAGGGIIADGRSAEFHELLGNGGGGNGGTGGSGSAGAGGAASEQTVVFEVADPGLSGGDLNQRGGGAGGGALSINVTGSLVLDGLVSANGLAGFAGTGGGGGSGGGIAVDAGLLSGTGSISVNGGAGDSLAGGGGGGGRISISCRSNSFAGAITAYGGPGFAAGGAGTIYVENLGDTISQVTVDNGGLVGTNTPISSLPSCDLTVANGAKAALTGVFSDETRNLLVTNDSFIIIPGPPQYNGADGFRLQLTGNAEIEPGCGIVADGAGYAGGLGPSAGASSISNSLTTGGGGGYGGNGGASAFGAAGGATLNVPPAQPGTPALGSGGGAGIGQIPHNLGGAGGGSLILDVKGTLALNGILSANGAPGVGEGSGGGSGGGIEVMAQSFSGNGTISANGGAGQLAYGGGGGGGIIEILLETSNQFAGNFSAHGGMGATAGGAGVVFEEPPANGSVTQVILDNGGLSGAYTPAPNVENEYDLTIIGGAIMLMPGNSTLEGEPRNLSVGSNSFITVSNGTMTLSLSSNMTIVPSGGVAVDGQGLRSGAGDGAGRTIDDNGGGGGYGGPGGAGAGGALGGAIYGSVTEPQGAGSGGGGEEGFDGRANSGGSGGGGVQIHVGGTLALGGAISANGAAGQLPGGGGGGSGGSIWLTVGALTGAGSISANGGAGQLPGGGGGGGRIVVFGPSSLFTGSMTAHGGAGFANGGAGTIYSALNGNGLQSQVIVDNGGLSSAPTSLASLELVSNLTVRGGAVATLPPRTIQNLLIGSNGILLPTNAPLSVEGNATVQAGGSILLNGIGFSDGVGAGTNATSPGNPPGGSGGGHGGYGGGSATGAFGGTSYDQFNAPTDVGSVGGPGSGEDGASALGGGVLQLTVTGKLQVDGLISADGAAASNEGGGGGSGGSLFLTAGVMAGAGVISANGGAGDLRSGGGGGGGRIALIFSNDLFTGSCQASGGPGFIAGGAGTIYLGSKSQSSPGASNQLIVDNGGLMGAATPIASTPAYGLTAAGGAVVVPQTPGVEITLDSLMVVSNAVITTSGPLGDLSIVVLGDALVETNAAISADGLGYVVGNPGPGAGEVATNSAGSGGGYGGAGGESAGGAAGGATYGSPQQPTFFGSEGGVVFAGDLDLSDGGGVVNLDVGGTLTVNGTVSADGNAGLFPGAGGGSGGSVWLTVGTLAGQGVMSADGGAGQGRVGGGGGGGRLAIYSRTNTFSGDTMVDGGAGFANGQAGTVYIATNGSGPSVIAQTPDAVASPPVNSVELTFDSPLDFDSLSSAGWTVTTPSGTLTKSDVVVSLSGANLTLSFPSQSAVGNYSVRVGSGIENIYGLAMAASYTGSFSILPPPVVLISSVVTNNASLNLQWTGLGGLSYQTEFSRDLIYWQPYGSPIISSNGPNVLVLPVGADSGTFYRLVLAK
jgi:hypothetical protein